MLPFKDDLGIELKDHIFKSSDKLCDLINKRIVHQIHADSIGIWDYSFISKLGVSGKKVDELLEIMKEDNILIQNEVDELGHVFKDHEFDFFANEQSN